MRARLETPAGRGGMAGLGPVLRGMLRSTTALTTPSRLAPAALACATVMISGTGLANPENGTVISGAVNLGTPGPERAITPTSGKALIPWDTKTEERRVG